MTDSKDPVTNLVGSSLADYIALTNEPSSEETEKFLTDISIVMNSDPDGAVGFIDKTEAAAAAHLLYEEYPALNRTLITASDISAYVSQMTFDDVMTSAAKAVEKEAKAAAERFRTDSTDEIIFQGKKYSKTEHDVTKIINSRLKQAGSSMRIFVAGSPYGGTSVIYGKLKSETTETLGGKQVITIAMERFDIKHNIESGMLAVNNGLSTIVIMRDELSQNIDAHRGTARRGGYKPEVHSQMHKEFFGGRSDKKAAIEVLSDLVRAHETGHFKLEEKFGAEPKLLSRKLLSQGNNTLHILIELASELALIDHIADTASKDPSVARQEVILWGIVRGSPSSSDALEECSLNALLGAARIENGAVTVDFELLRARSNSLWNVLFDTFGEVVRNIRLDIGMEDASSYENLKKQAADTVKVEKPRIDPQMAKLIVVANIVDIIFSRKDVAGRPLSVSFHGDMIVYQRRIDDWMRQNLGLTDETVPFKVPNVAGINLNELPPAEQERAIKLLQEGQ